MKMPEKEKDAEREFLNAEWEFIVNDQDITFKSYVIDLRMLNKAIKGRTA